MRYIVDIDEHGTKTWYNENNKKHREDGPAVECSNGQKEWWKNGKLHREDGPAVEWSIGTKYWYLNGKEYSEEAFNFEMDNKKNYDMQMSMYEALKAMHKEFVQENDWALQHFMGKRYSEEEQNAINKCLTAISKFEKSQKR